MALVGIAPGHLVELYDVAVFAAVACAWSTLRPEAEAERDGRNRVGALRASPACAVRE